MRLLLIQVPAIRAPALRTLALWTLALAGLLLTSWPAAAQLTREEIALRNQLYELQQQMQALQQQAGQGGGTYLGRQGGAPPQSTGGNDVVAQLLTRVQSLEEEVRSLRGRVDEVQNQLQQQGADLGKRIDDMKFQLQNPQAGGSAPAEAAPGAGPGVPGGPIPGLPQQQYQQYPQYQQQGPGGPIPLQPSQQFSPPPGALGSTTAPPMPPAGPPVRRTPETAMQEGYAALARRDYPTAETAAHDVLTNNRTSPRAYDAQFLLAQALFGERQYSQAAIAYDDTYNRNRKGSRAPEALVGLASSLTAINEKRAACDTLTKLHAEFPQVHQELRDAAAGVAQRAGCR